MTVESAKKELVKQGEIKSFPKMLQLYEDEVSKALPQHLRDNVQRYSRLALTAFRTNPKLAECDPRSVFAGVILASQLGLELNTMGQCYLVPYMNRRTGNYEAQFIPGWKGYVDLIHRSGRAVVWTGCVFAGDQFDYMQGDSPFVRHKTSGEDDESKITHAYAIGRIKGIDWPIVEIWPVEKIKRHRDRVNKVGKSHYSYENWEMYCRKVPLLQVAKYLPASVEMLSQLSSLDNSYESGSQNLTIDAVAEGLVFPSSDLQTAAEPAKEEQKQEPAKAEPVKEQTTVGQQVKTTKAAAKDAAKAVAEKVESKPEPITPEVVEPSGEDVADIAKEATAKVEEQAAEQAEPEKKAEAPAQEQGKELRGVRFPVQLVEAEGYEKHTKAQLDKANAEAARIGINLAVFVQKRLGVDVGALNEQAMDKLLELLKGVS